MNCSYDNQVKVNVDSNYFITLSILKDQNKEK